MDGDVKNLFRLSMVLCGFSATSIAAQELQIINPVPIKHPDEIILFTEQFSEFVSGLENDPEFDGTAKTTTVASTKQYKNVSSTSVYKTTDSKEVYDLSIEQLQVMRDALVRKSEAYEVLTNQGFDLRAFGTFSSDVDLNNPELFTTDVTSGIDMIVE